MTIVKSMLGIREHPVLADGALLLLRLSAGVAFMVHGWPKIQHPFSWMGPNGFAPPPFQGLAALSEFGGGLALILGLLIPLACFGIACTMAVAFSFMTFARGAPFVSLTGGPASELPAIYFCAAVLLLALGPGRFSLDRLLFGRRRRRESAAMRAG